MLAFQSHKIVIKCCQTKLQRLGLTVASMLGVVPFFFRREVGAVCTPNCMMTVTRSQSTVFDGLQD